MDHPHTAVINQKGAGSHFRPPRFTQPPALLYTCFIHLSFTAAGRSLHHSHLPAGHLLSLSTQQHHNHRIPATPEIHNYQWTWTAKNQKSKIRIEIFGITENISLATAWRKNFLGKLPVHRVKVSRHVRRGLVREASVASQQLSLQHYRHHQILSPITQIAQPFTHLDFICIILHFARRLQFIIIITSIVHQ